MVDGLSEVAWEDPPPIQGSTQPVGIDIANMLRTSPGRWARIGERETPGSARSRAHQIRQGVLAAYRPAGHFEAVARTVDGAYVIYARYVGEVRS